MHRSPKISQGRCICLSSAGCLEKRCFYNSFQGRIYEHGIHVHLSPKKRPNENSIWIYSHAFPISNKEQKEDAPRELLAIILFHTGAGPQDIFLRWKADMLIRELKDCVVFIADIICDEDGYAWSDREKYEQSRKYVLARYKEEHGRIARMNLRHYVAAAIEHLKSLNFVRISDIAAMGYCMGGHPILELGLMQDDSIKALITYHGVFDGIKDYDLPPEDELVDTTIRSWDSKSTKVLICNGKEDPFVDQDDVQKAKILLEKKGCDVRVLNFEHVRHGFTNPAQDYNPSDAFAYNDFAAKDSWDSTIQLLKDVF